MLSEIPGYLVSLKTPDAKAVTLDGFWSVGKVQHENLLIFVHGMGSNFYKSRLKKTWLTLGPKHGFDVLSFNNRGCEANVADETFSDCIGDLDAAMSFARAKKYRRVILLGHSTGCQKITYYCHRRRPRLVRGLILAALGDDLAIARRDLGAAYGRWLTRAQSMVAEGQGHRRLPPQCLGFSARRFLSAASPRALEANLFRLDGPMTIFSKITLPILALFPEQEQYACIPVHEAARRLSAKTRSRRFSAIIIPEADHSFHGREVASVQAAIPWLNEIVTGARKLL